MTIGKLYIFFSDPKQAIDFLEKMREKVGAIHFTDYHAAYTSNKSKISIGLTHSTWDTDVSILL